MQKNILILSFFLISFLSFSQEFKEAVQLKKDILELNWETTYTNALKRSKKENKPVLIYFTGSDWCGPCIKLDKELFHTEKFKKLSNEFLILLEVDSPKRQDLLSQEKISENSYLKNKYKINSFPTLLFVNYKGRKVGEKKGYIMVEYYYPFIESVINNYN
ncbi:MAG: thioredoxin family protein [Polaribacter sp.]